MRYCFFFSFHRYMLTDEGREVANECITRSGLPTLDILSDDETDPATQDSISEQTAIPSDILEKVHYHFGASIFLFSVVCVSVNFFWFSSIVYTVWVFQGTSRCCIQRGFRWISGQRSINSLVICNVPSSSSRSL